jgi:putative ABC transport system permease protein
MVTHDAFAASFCRRVIFIKDGSLSIFCGIILGVMFSKYFSLMLIYLMRETLNIEFTIAFKAFYITILVFFVFFLLNSIHSYSITYRYKIIELLSAQKQGEKDPKASWIMSVLSLILILLGYFMSYNKTTVQLIKVGISVIILVSIGTYLLFNSLIIILVQAIKKNKRFYYRGENMVSTAQILYRIKSNAKILCIISLLSAVTLTSIGVFYSFYKTTEEDINKNMPFSYEFINTDKELNEKIENMINIP